MNLNVPVDLRENIMIITDTYPSVDKLLAAICDYPFLTNIIIEQTLPQLQKFAEANYGCELSISTFCTIEGHASIEVHLAQSGIDIKNERTNSLVEKNHEDFSWILATILPRLWSMRE